LDVFLCFDFLPPVGAATGGPSSEPCSIAGPSSEGKFIMEEEEEEEEEEEGIFGESLSINVTIAKVIAVQNKKKYIKILCPHIS
jgi:hypothetical protein